MRSWIGLFGLALAAGILQATLLARVGSFLPLNLLLVMAVLVGLQRDPATGALMVFGLGYLQDIFSASIPGMHMTAWLMVFFIAQVARVRLSPESAGVQLLLGLLLCTAEEFFIVLLSRVFSEPITLEARQFGMIGLAVLAEAALTALLFPLFRWILDPEPRG